MSSDNAVVALQNDESRDEELICVSYSRLSSYGECAYKCKHEPSMDNPSNLVGNAFHSGKAEQIKSGDVAKGLAVVQRLIPEYGIDSAGAKDLLDMYSRIANDPRYNWPKDRIISVEGDEDDVDIGGRKYFQVPIPVKVDGKRVALRGAMDVVLFDRKTGGIEIVDWKTGFKDANPFQGELYALAAHLKYFKAAPITVRFVYTRRGFSTKETYGKADMPAILRYIAILATCYIRETEWAPKFGPGCKNCPFTSTCEVYLDKMSKIPANPKVDPENWAAIQLWKDHLGALSGAAKKFYEEVCEKEKQYLKKHGKGPIGEGREAYLAEQTARYEYPSEAVFNLLSEAGIDPKKSLEWSGANIDRIIEDAVAKKIITPEKAEELDDRLKGKKDNKGNWVVEPIRVVGSTSEKVRTRAVKE